MYAIFCKPTRYTYEFLKERFFLSFTEEWRKALIFAVQNQEGILIKRRDGACSFTLNGTTGFEQARMIIECKKIYFQDLDPDNFLDPSINNNYAKNDYHRLYVGEIRNVYVKE